MNENILSTILIGVVLILLILDIIIAVLILRCLRTIRRLMNLLEAAIDDAERFSRIVKKISWPITITRVIKKLIELTPNKSKPKK